MEDIYINIDSRMQCVDSEGYKYSTTLYLVKNDLFNKNHKFSVRNPNAYDNYLNYMKIHCNNKTILISKKSVKDGENLIFLCGLCGSEFKQSWKVFRDFNPHFCCQDCSKQIAIKSETKKIEDVYSIINNLNLKWIYGEYKNNLSKLHVEDEIGYKGIISLTSLQSGSNFMKFYIHNPYTIINLRLYLKINKIDLKIPTQEYIIEGQNVNFICKCGNDFSTAIDTFFRGKHQCNICTKSQSNYETKIEEFLKKLNIKFVKQYRIDNCKFIKPLPFDFYVTNYGVIEVDGEGHFYPTRFNGTSMYNAIDTYQRTKHCDKIKDEYCTKNNIKLLRISYIDINNNNYKKILQNELKSIIV